MEQVVAEFGIPIDPDAEGKRAGKLPGDLLAALGDAGENGDHTKHRDEPKEPVLVAHFLQVEAGKIAAEKSRPGQKEADAQAGGAKVGQVRPAQADGLILPQLVDVAADSDFGLMVISSGILIPCG